MFKISKKLTALLVVAVMLITSMLSLQVSAAEISTAPWAVYFSSNKDSLVTADWRKQTLNASGENSYFGTDDTGNNSGESMLISRTPVAAYDNQPVIKTRTDNDTYKSLAIEFKAPSTGEYKLSALLVNAMPLKQGNVSTWYVNKATAAAPLALTEVTSGTLSGNSEANLAYADYNKSDVDATVELNAGDRLYFSLYMEANTIWLVMPKFEVKDLTTGRVMSLFNVGSVLQSADVTKTYRPSDYEYVATTATEGVWSVYHRPNNSVDFTNWVDLQLTSTTKDTVLFTNGLRDKSENAGSMIYFSVFTPDSTFLWQPWFAAESPKNGAAFGWTAPYTGDWLVHVKAYHRDLLSNSGNSTAMTFNIGSKAADATTVNVLATENLSNVKGTANNELLGIYERDVLLSVEEGETIFLMANGDLDSEINFQYIISDMNNPSVMYDASKMSNHHMVDANGNPSPFTFGQAADKNVTKETINGVSTDVFLRNYWLNYNDARTTNIVPLDLYSNENFVWTNSETSWSGTWPCLALDKANDKLRMTTRTSGKSPVVMFTAPEDGNYLFDLKATNVEYDASNTQSTTGKLYLYRTGGPLTEGGDWYYGGGHYDEANYMKAFDAAEIEWEKTFLNMKKGETLILNALSYNDQKKVYHVDLAVSKLADVDFIYEVDGEAADSFADISAAAGTGELSLNCKLLDTGDYDAATATLILAVYDSQGVLKATKISDAASLSGNGSYVDLSVSMTIPADIAGGKVQAFVWDNCNTIRPLVAKDVISD